MKIVFKENGENTRITDDEGKDLLHDLNTTSITIKAQVGEPTNVVLECFFSEASISVLPENVVSIYNDTRLTSKQRKAIAEILKGS